MKNANLNPDEIFIHFDNKAVKDAKKTGKNRVNVIIEYSNGKKIKTSINLVNGHMPENIPAYS